MAVVDKQYLGRWNGGELYARIFGSKNYLTQPSGDGGFMVRGRGLLGNTDAGYMAPTTGALTQADIDSFVASDTFGVQRPQIFETPTGYTKVSKNGADIYYLNTLIEQNPELMNEEKEDKKGERSADTFLTKAWAWIQANPFQSVAIAVGLYIFVLEPILNGGGKKKKSLLAKLF